MNIDDRLIYEDEVGKILNCAFEVSNFLGPGFAEKPYERALCHEFELQGVNYSQQEKFSLIYKTAVVGEYIPDLVVFNKIIVEIKSIDRITEVERAQVLNYLNVTGYNVGLLLNFRHSKLEWKKYVL